MATAVALEATEDAVAATVVAATVGPVDINSAEDSTAATITVERK